MRITVEYVERKIDRKLSLAHRVTYKVTTIWLFGFIPIFRKRERIMEV